MTERPWLLLDLAGVLLSFAPDRRIALLARMSGHDAETVRARLAADGISERLDTGDADGDALAESLAAITGRRMDADEAWRTWLVPFAPDRIAFAALPALAPRFRLGVFTNNAEAIARIFDTSPFERMFFSSDLRVRKPDPKSYARVTSALGVAPGEIRFIDDGRANVEAARQAGWRASLFSAGDTLAACVAAL